MFERTVSKWSDLQVFAEEIPLGEVTSYISVFMEASLTGLWDHNRSLVDGVEL